MKQRIKYWKVIYLLLEYALRASLIHLRQSNLRLQSNLLLNLMQSTSRRILRALAVNVEIKGRQDLIQQKRPYLVVGNHASYLDMLILGSIYPCIFVSSLEQKENGPIGKIAQLAGTIFVDRINKSRLPEDVDTIARHMAAGIPLCLYLEGTTSNGRMILPFKSSLLGAIEEKDVEILPVCIRYTHVNGEPLEGDAFDLVAWYGSMSFFPHFRKLNALQSIRAELTVLETIQTRGELSRKTIASTAQEAIQTAFVASNPLVSMA